MQTHKALLTGEAAMLACGLRALGEAHKCRPEGVFRRSFESIDYRPVLKCLNGYCCRMWSDFKGYVAAIWFPPKPDQIAQVSADQPLLST